MKSRFEIRHEVGIKASLEKVFESLTKIEGLTDWWTKSAGESKVGGTLEFWFDDFCQKFKVIALEPRQLVRWRATEGVEEWKDTEIEFRIEPESEGNQTLVHFRHLGWADNSGMLAHCTTKWAVFLLSLKDLLETGTGHPHPKDVQINHY